MCDICLFNISRSSKDFGIFVDNINFNIINGLLYNLFFIVRLNILIIF